MSTNLNASAILPPEILDKILERIPIDRLGRQTLMVCALVATWWTGPSQRRLFSSVEIREDNYEQWINGVVLPGPKVHLLEHVRSLWHRRDLDSGTRYRMQDLVRDSGTYLSALRNLHILTLFKIRVEHISEDQFHTCFSAFRGTLTYLSLDTFATSFSAFVTLVDYFPNVRTLRLGLTELEPDERPIPPLSRPLRGKLLVHHVRSNSLKFLDQFAELDLEYEELIIGSLPSLFMRTRFLESALQISTNTVKFLRLTAELRSGVEVSVRDFRQLQELELEVAWPSSPHQVFSSITSTEIRKIIFPLRYLSLWSTPAERTEARALIDGQLCGLVDRLRVMGYRHTLEAELRLTANGDDPGKDGFTSFLPRFKEKGIVTITDAVNGNLLHSSTHDR